MAQAVRDSPCISRAGRCNAVAGNGKHVHVRACSWRSGGDPPWTQHSVHAGNAAGPKKSAGLIGSDKDAARSRAIQLYPELRALDAKAKGRAIADALLIARFGIGVK